MSGAPPSRVQGSLNTLTARTTSLVLRCWSRTFQHQQDKYQFVRFNSCAEACKPEISQYLPSSKWTLEKKNMLIGYNDALVSF